MTALLIIIVLAAAAAVAVIGLIRSQARAATLAAENESLRRERAALVQAHKDELGRVEQQHERARAELRTQWEAQLGTLRHEFDRLTAEHLGRQQEQLKATNRESVESVLAPLRLTIDAFKREFADKMTDTARADAAMRTLIDALSQQTGRLCVSADNLSHALRADPKRQGDWGEAILDHILRASGLTPDIDYTTQPHISGGGEATFIPDVTVRLRGEATLIIDSKTSIKAYLDYVAATDAEAQARAVREHVASVRRHVAELAEKHYPDHVPSALQYVLMFIPNDASYLLAVHNDPQLAIDAYNRHVIIVNPTNLMLALKIVWLFQQSERQAKSVQEIIDRAKKMYEKFATFTDTFVELDTRLRQTLDTYERARGQLSAGRGNLARQFDSFRTLGLIPGKSINAALLKGEE